METKLEVIEPAGPDTKVELGDIVRDEVTGFEGVVNSITIWRYGCRRIGVLPTKLKEDGGIHKAEVIDEPALHILKRADIPQHVQQQRQEAGGPKDAAAEAAALSR